MTEWCFTFCVQVFILLKSFIAQWEWYCLPKFCFCWKLTEVFAIFMKNCASMFTNISTSQVEAYNLALKFYYIECYFFTHHKQNHLYQLNKLPFPPIKLYLIKWIAIDLFSCKQRHSAQESKSLLKRLQLEVKIY